MSCIHGVQNDALACTKTCVVQTYSLLLILIVLLIVILLQFMLPKTSHNSVAPKRLSENG